MDVSRDLKKCKNGHLRTPENLYHNDCKLCRSERSKKWWQKVKERDKLRNRQRALDRYWSNPELYKQKAKDWRYKNSDKVKQTRIKRKHLNLIQHRQREYNLTQDVFLELLEKQNHACKICKRLFTASLVPVVDHDHACCSATPTCGLCTRALLCHGCNKVLGLLYDNLERAKNVVSYLEEYGNRCSIT